MRTALLAMAVLAATIVLPATATAGNWYGATGNTGCGGNMQDNDDMTYHRDDSLSSEMNSAHAYALRNAVRPTNINLQSEHSSAKSHTDVVMFGPNYTGSFCGFIWHGSSGGTLLGYASCRRLSGSKCDQFHIYTDRSWEETVTTNRRRAHACHELGHTLGLVHPAGSAEDEDESCVGNSSQLDYSDHDKDDHINENY